MLDYISTNAGMIGLLFFISIFVCIFLWLFKPGSKQKIESYKYIPLSEENNDLK